MPFFCLATSCGFPSFFSNARSPTHFLRHPIECDSKVMRQREGRAAAQAGGREILLHEMESSAHKVVGN